MTQAQETQTAKKTQNHRPAAVKQLSHHLLAGQLPFEELQNLGKFVLLVNLSAYGDPLNRAQGVSDNTTSTLPDISP